MKYYLRNLIAKISSYLEIYLSGIILLEVIFASVGLVIRIFNIFRPAIDHNFFSEFLGHAMALIIAVEFIKMLSRHTPGSAIEVLIFALARKLIIKENISASDLLMGVVAIGLLLLIRHYVGNEGKEGTVVSAATSLKDINKLAGLNLREGIAQTLGGLLFLAAQKDSKKLQEGDCIKIEGVKFRVNRLRDGIIEQVEIIKD